MESKPAKKLYLVGVAIIVLGSLGAIILGNKFPITSGYYYVRESFNWGLCLTGIVTSIISGLVFIALSEMAESLYLSEQHLKKIEEAITGKHSEENALPEEKTEQEDTEYGVD